MQTARGVPHPVDRGRPVKLRVDNGPGICAIDVSTINRSADRPPEHGGLADQGGDHDATKEHDALGHSVVDWRDPGIRLRLCPATRTPNTSPNGGAEPVSDGDRGSRPGTTRADELHAGGHNGIVRVADGALVGRKARRRTGTQRCTHRALRFKRPPAQGVTMDRTKPIQEGVRVKLPAGVTWESLAAMSPDQIRDQNLYPKGFYPLPHPKHQEGGFVFPHFLIDAIKQQDGRDLKRFDVDFDLPDHFLAEFPPAIYLPPRTDLGDVSQGKLVSLTNYYQLFNGILTPRQLEGLRLLLTPFPQQQFNATEDRRSELPSTGAACFDCHSNGHQNGATHEAP